MQRPPSLICCLLLLILGGCNAGPVGGLAECGDVNRTAVFEPGRIETLMRSVRDDQQRRMSNTRYEPYDEWIPCAFYVGMMEAFEATRDSAYYDPALAWARANAWEIGARTRHADDQCAGQVYLDIYLHAPAPHRIAHTQEAFNAMMVDSRPGHEAWDWADALFMAPPALARLGAITGNEAYWTFMDDMFWDAAEPLYDSEAGLYYRDAQFVGRRSENGAKIFWARGNGWVLAGMARVLQHLPAEHPARGRFVTHFQTMAEAVARTQGRDGRWRPSLHDPEAFPSPETSATGFFCYALAWGVRQGILDAETYLPVVRQAWHGLARAVQPSGTLAWVQAPGDRPESVDCEDTQAYGSGAFLLAGSEVLRLTDTAGLSR